MAAGGLVAVMISWVRPPLYASQATFMAASDSYGGVCDNRKYYLVEQQQGSRPVVCGDVATFKRFLSSASGESFDPGFLTSVIQKEGLYSRERARKPMDAVIGEMRRNIHVSSPEKSSRRQFAMLFDYPDAAIAQRVDEELAAQVIMRTLDEKFSQSQEANSKQRLRQLTFLQKRLRLAKNATEANYLRDAIRGAEAEQSVNTNYRPPTVGQVLVADGTRMVLVFSRESLQPKLASFPLRPDGLTRLQMDLVGLLGGLVCGLSLAAAMRPGRGALIIKG